jgi:hypothetical protein
MVKIMIVFYSMYGHCHKLAEAEAEGARELDGVGGGRQIQSKNPKNKDILEILTIFNENHVKFFTFSIDRHLFTVHNIFQLTGFARFGLEGRQGFAHA